MCQRLPRAVSSSGFELEDVLQTIIRHAVELSGADFGNVLQPQGDYYQMVAFHGEVTAEYLELVTKFEYRPDRGSMIGRTLVEKRPVQIVDVLADPEYTAWEIQKAGKYRTVLGVPMLRGDEWIGLFVVLRFEVKAFTEQQISLLSTFADQAVLAIDNLRLIQTIQNQRTELARYAPQAAELMSTDKGAELLAGHRRQITAMFCDLRGFTAFAESAEPEEVLGVLREYHSMVGEIVVGAGGTVEHFAGDGLMAFFGAPLADPEHAEHAVRAGLAMLARLEELNAGWKTAGRPALEIGIGIHTGDAVVGFIGDEERRMDYTAIGDSVNLASRLEGMNKELGTRILVSADTAAQLPPDLVTSPRGVVQVKGRGRPVAVHTLEKAPDRG